MNDSWLDSIEDAFKSTASDVSTNVVQFAGNWFSSQAQNILDPRPAVNANPTAAQIAAGQTGQASGAVLYPSGALSYLVPSKTNFIIPAIVVIAGIYLIKKGLK